MRLQEKLLIGIFLLTLVLFTYYSSLMNPKSLCCLLCRTAIADQCLHAFVSCFTSALIRCGAHYALFFKDATALSELYVLFSCMKRIHVLDSIVGLFSASQGCKSDYGQAYWA